MASVRKRVSKAGSVTFQVRWREDGWQSERFVDENQADEFRRLVDTHGQKWPTGWVRGGGFLEEEPAPGDMLLREWAHRYIERLTGIDERTRNDYRRDVDLHISMIRHTSASGQVLPATVANINRNDVQDWPRMEQSGERDPTDPMKWKRRPAGPKFIANRHGLLFAIVQAAVEADPPLRASNCCRGSPAGKAGRSHRRGDDIPRA